MEYNWLQALEMMANGQPMHVVGDVCYFKYFDGLIGKYEKSSDEYIRHAIISEVFIKSTFEPYHCEDAEPGLIADLIK